MLSRHATPFDLFEKLEQQLAQAERVPAAEVLETDAAFQITVELPGAAKDSIDVKATDRSLVISAERAQPESEREGEALVSEFRYGSWSRSFRFPKGIQRDELKASYRDGLLRITAPKAESNAPRAASSTASNSSVLRTCTGRTRSLPRHRGPSILRSRHRHPLHLRCLWSALLL